jgi:acetyl-CoA carboxylase biotin carboxylase subunit
VKKIQKVLIANRGEIAIRVIRSCRELGISTVAIHSTADEDSIHVKLADESVCIGPPKSKDSYLNFHQVLSAIEITDSDAVHPGYGFLSENTEFAKICDDWNLTFIGPNADCIEDMGDKVRSKKIAKEAGVPILETIEVNKLEDDQIKAKVLELGFPVIIKASAGGGGRGMRRIDNIDQLMSTIPVLKEESRLAFGDDTLFIEKYITNPRHIEIQILADKYGNAIHLGERDCTIQRRYQKVIEESPSPVIDEKTRELMCQSALNLAKKVSYDSVGTVEYLYDMDEKKFYFMEMNTRIQVEHPVTEVRTGVDLIKEQILVAQGEELKLKQSDIKFDKHVIEYRINAENGETGMPSPGLITHYHRPGGIGVRVDDYIYTGYLVPSHYDSMISKIIVNADDRDQCITRSERVLNETVVGGIDTNISLHLSILNHPDFRANQYNTNFLNEKMLK